MLEGRGLGDAGVNVAKVQLLVQNQEEGVVVAWKWKLDG